MHYEKLIPPEVLNNCSQLQGFFTEWIIPEWVYWYRLNTDMQGDITTQTYLVADSVLYFLADDGIHGRRLWKTDGTTVGRQMVKDITSGAASSEIFSMSLLQNKLVFLLYNSVNKSFK